MNAIETWAQTHLEMCASMLITVHLQQLQTGENRTPTYKKVVPGGVLCNNKKESLLTKKHGMHQRRPHSFHVALWGEDCVRIHSWWRTKEGWELFSGMIEMSAPSTNTHLQWGVLRPHCCPDTKSPTFPEVSQR